MIKETNAYTGVDNASVGTGTDLVGQDRRDPGTTARDDAAEQVAILNRERIPRQTIVTIKEAQDWLEKHGFPRIAGEGESAQLLDKVISTTAFNRLNIFDRIRDADNEMSGGWEPVQRKYLDCTSSSPYNQSKMNFQN